MTVTGVPTIRATIEQILPPSAQRDYRYLIDNVVQALEAREREILGRTEGHPIEDEIIRRLNEDTGLPTPTLKKAERIAILEDTVAGLVQFARGYGYHG